MNNNLLKQISKYQLEEYEANILFSLSILLTHKINALSKEYRKNIITTKQYINVKRKYMDLIEKFKNDLEEISYD